MTIIQINAMVKGRVQGVGFRNWTYSQARLFGLTGWVKNAPEGEVSILAEGEEEQLEEFLTALKQGPRLSRISDVIVERKTVVSRDYQNFEVLKE